MGRLLVICFVLVYSLLTASAQGDDLPRCNADTIFDFPEVGPEIRELEREMGLAETMDDMLRLNAEHLTLRRKLWEDMHLCDMNLDFVSLLSARFNDIFAASAIEGLSPSQGGGPRWQLIEGMGGEAIGLLLSNLGDRFLSGLTGGGGDAPEESLAACTEAQRQYARGAKLVDYINIMEQALAVETVEDLLRYDAAQLAFREGAWSDLPRCADAYEVAILVVRISGDFVVAHALAFLGVPRESNPYPAQLVEDIAQLPAWMIPAALRDVDAVYALFESNLPACAADELAWALSLRHPLLGPDGELAENFLDGISRSNLGVQAAAEISWRDRHLAASPRCTEALELALAMSEIGNDIVVAAGFSLANEPELTSLYPEQALLGANRLRRLLADIADARERSYESEAIQNPLPACTADQLLTPVQTVLASWGEMETILSTLKSRADFARYAQAQFQWRRDLLQRLPGCAEAVELGSLLHQGAGIIAGFFALDFAGIKPENNAYVRANQDLADEITPLLAQIQQILSTLE